MPVCSKCSIDKPIDQYAIDKQPNKIYRKRYCNDCFRKQSRDWKKQNRVKKKQLIELPQPKEIIEPVVLELQPGYKICFTCNEIKSFEQYYHSRYGTAAKNCKSCVSEKSKATIKEKTRQNGGSERVPHPPNEYADEEQKEQTFWVMKLMGWTYNDNGVWSKEGFKDKNKVWYKFEEKVKPKRPANINGGRKILPVHKKVNEVIQKHKEGYGFYDLAYIYECSHTTIRKIINNHNDEARTN